MSFETDRFKTRIDAHDTITVTMNKYNALMKLEQQYIGRLDVYNAMDAMGIDTETINKIKNKFHDRLDY